MATSFGCANLGDRTSPAVNLFHDRQDERCGSSALRFDPSGLRPTTNPTTKQEAPMIESRIARLNPEAGIGIGLTARSIGGGVGISD